MSTIKVQDIQHTSNSADSISIASDSSVSLKHSGSAKLATSATGVSITGTCTATTFSGSLASSNLTGALPAIDGSALTGITSGVSATGGTFTGSVTFEDAINENVFAITEASSMALDPDNGMIQTLTLTDHRTVTDSLTTGQSMLLIIQTSASNTYTLTWPTIKWKGGSAPTLSTTDVTAVELFKVGTQLYGVSVGDLS